MSSPRQLMFFYPVYFPGMFLKKHALSTTFPTSLSLVYAHIQIPRKPSFLLQQWVENKIVPNWLHMWESVLLVDAYTTVPLILPSSFPLPLLPPSANIAAVVCLLFLSFISFSWAVVEVRPPVSRVPWRPFSPGLRGNPSNGGEIVPACVKCALCVGKHMCVWKAHTREVTKGMMESCQSREVPRRGTAIRGRCVCVQNSSRK